MGDGRREGEAVADLAALRQDAGELERAVRRLRMGLIEAGANLLARELGAQLCLPPAKGGPGDA